MNGPTEQFQDQVVATGSDDHLAVRNVPQRPSTSATSPATRRRRRLGMIVVPGRGDLYDEMRAKKRQQRDDENVSISIGEPTASVHPRKRKAASVNLTAAEQVVARTREQWTAATVSCVSADAYEEPSMVVITEGNRDHDREDGALLDSRVINVQFPEEDIPMRSSDGHEKKSSGAGASTVRLRPVKPYKIARPETADQWRIEAMQMVQSARKYSEHNGYFCRRNGCDELLETVEALAEHLRHHDSIYTSGPAVKQCGRCGGMYESDREIRMHKCRSGGRSSSPSKRSLLTMTLPQPVKTQIRKVKNIAQRCVAAVASTRKVAPTSRRYEPY